ncbi:MAG: EF-P lysine aminoacylase GenX [Deltaproteobacteria bacterium]|nr:MAG: EF-P lysine aminoacylase GenX [Deltaproteobacteria bacterium]
MPATAQMARARSRLARALRDGLEARGYLEAETPIAVPFAGQEPHLRPFETIFTPDLPSDVEGARRLHLHTSPEYAMKRLLAREGFSRCYQLARVFRDGEASATHNPEFTLLELYAAPGDATAIMADLEQLIAEGARALNGRAQAPGRRRPIDLEPPFERLTCREAFSRHAGFDPLPLDAEALAQAARTTGVRTSPGASWDDLFTQLLIDKVEPSLGIEKPTYLTDYPASQAALARIKPGGVADRFELYAGGLELANGFSELNDSSEQRKRLEAEQRQRAALGREVFPLDEKFLAALDRMPDAGGVAVGFDRLLMLLSGARTIAEVLLFPAAEEYPAARRAK